MDQANSTAPRHLMVDGEGWKERQRCL